MPDIVIADTSCFILLSISSVKPLLSKIKQTNFRVSSTLEELALKQAGE